MSPVPCSWISPLPREQRVSDAPNSQVGWAETIALNGGWGGVGGQALQEELQARGSLFLSFPGPDGKWKEGFLDSWQQPL